MKADTDSVRVQIWLRLYPLHTPPSLFSPRGHDVTLLPATLNFAPLRPLPASSSTPVDSTLEVDPVVPMCLVVLCMRAQWDLMWTPFAEHQYPYFALDVISTHQAPLRSNVRMRRGNIYATIKLLT